MGPELYYKKSPMNCHFLPLGGSKGAGCVLLLIANEKSQNRYNWTATEAGKDISIDFGLLYIFWWMFE